MTHPQIGSFSHRIDPDGFMEAICPVCFRTIGHTRTQAELHEQELLHRCDPDAADRFNLMRAPHLHTY